MSDSDFRSGSDAEWADLLRQLGQQAHVQPRPFFYARVHARLVAAQAPATAWLPAWVRRPAYAALLGALVLAVSGDGPAQRAGAPASHYGSYHLSQPMQLAPH
jgi:hypothetical protein